ncbi:MAG: molybdopterin molybdotransferase MoeA [Planctomycetes bacterium]|nr:molybdopterin molybdotransferase MoeA [Planctomycetota bacterium]
MTSLPDYRDALNQALAVVEPLPGTETIQLESCAGRVLAETITADRDLPPFNRAQMDGYALRASELGQLTEWPVITSIPAGNPGDVVVPPGQCVMIATGAPLPDDVDTVIQHELSDRGDPVHFTIDKVEPGRAVHPRGVDAKTGDTLIEPPVVLAAHHLGIAASAGKASLQVAIRPRVTILSSGDEIVAVGSDVLPHQIRNSNGLQTAELLRRFGADPSAIIHVHDELDETIDAVRTAIDSSDLIITIGGISAGVRDHFPVAFETCGIESALHRASIQPGKPIMVGRAPDGTIIVGLPGNPVSALVCACIFIWPIVRVMLGLSPDLPWRKVDLAEEVKANPNRRAFRPARLIDMNTIVVPKWAGSGDLAHTTHTDGFVELPVQDEPVMTGTKLRFLAWP